MTRMTGPDCVVMCNLINTYIHTYIHTNIHTYILTGPDCVVMCNLINTYIHTYIHTYIEREANINWSMGDLPRQYSFGTTLRFTGPVPADSRQ